jgi:hypothetical protein
VLLNGRKDEELQKIPRPFLIFGMPDREMELLGKNCAK